MTGPFVPPEPGAQHYYDQIGSPIGPLLLTGRDDALTGLYMLAGPHGAGAPVPTGARREPAVFATVAARLAAYFDGEQTEFDVPLSPTGSAFQLDVWAELTRIPYGPRSATARWPDGWASRCRRPGRSARPTARTRSRSSCPATGSSAPTAA
jgi:hypothetical protein